jgi:hypothetical protein
MTDSDLLSALEGTFSRHSRPRFFTNADHCCECAEHNETLSRHTPSSLSINGLGQPGRDPVCFATPDAYLHLFPGLARLALTSRGQNSYLDQFVSQLSNRVHLLDAEERRVTLVLVWRLFEKFHEQPECGDFTLWSLDDCLRKLEQTDSAATEQA